MSYCRLSDGDVYMFPNMNEDITCCACSLVGKSIDFPTEREALMHLMVHRKAGHTVPQYAIDRLLEEIGPLTDWEILGQAVAECKRAFLNTATAFLSPILDAVERWLK